MSSHVRRQSSTWGRLAAIAVAILSVHLVVKTALAAATWETERIEDNTEECVRVHNRGASMMYVDNDCRETLEITLDSCDPDICEDKTYEVEYSEAIESYDIGASVLDFEDGETLEATFDVKRGGDSIGTITWVGEAQRSKTRGCTCPLLFFAPACC